MRTTPDVAYFPVSVSRDDGFTRLDRRGWFSSRPRSPDFPAALPRIELLWMPYYCVPVRYTSSRGEGVVRVAVEAHSGEATLVADVDMHHAPSHEGTELLPRLSGDEASEIARRTALRIVMIQRGRSKPIIVGTDPPSLLCCPFWVYYYERRRGMIDIKSLNAATGEPGGARTKRAILDALLIQSRRNP